MLFGPTEAVALAPKRGSCVACGAALDSRSHGPQLRWEAFLLVPPWPYLLLSGFCPLPPSTVRPWRPQRNRPSVLLPQAPAGTLGEAASHSRHSCSGSLSIFSLWEGHSGQEASCAAPGEPGWQRGTSLGQGPTQSNFAESRKGGRGEPGWVGLDVWAWLSSGLPTLGQVGEEPAASLNKGPINLRRS